ncbi:MAG: hypothetical protein ABH829_03885, partial [archaeon]
APVRVKVDVPARPVILNYKPGSGTYGGWEDQQNIIPIKITLEYALSGEVFAVVNTDQIDADFDGTVTQPPLGSLLTALADTDDASKIRDICGYATNSLAQGIIPNCVEELTIELDDGFVFVPKEHIAGGRAYCGGTKQTDNCHGCWDDGVDPDTGKCLLFTSYPDYQIMKLRPAKISTMSSRPEQYVIWIAPNPDYTTTDSPLNPQTFTQDSFKVTVNAKYTMNVVYQTKPVMITNVG